MFSMLREILNTETGLSCSSLKLIPVLTLKIINVYFQETLKTFSHNDAFLLSIHYMKATYQSEFSTFMPRINMPKDKVVCSDNVNKYYICSSHSGSGVTCDYHVLMQ
jgi:hypothetical protein